MSNAFFFLQMKNDMNMIFLCQYTSSVRKIHSTLIWFKPGLFLKQQQANFTFALRASHEDRIK